MKLAKIVKYLEKKFPLSKAKEWDKVGFQLFNKKIIDLEINIQKIDIVMDLTFDFFKTINKDNMPDLIITRHPFIFNELNKEKNNPFKKELVKFLTKHNILVYSIHTNYDYCGYEAFIEKMKKNLNIKKVKKNLFDKDYLKVELSSNISAETICEGLKNSFTDIHLSLNKNLTKEEYYSTFFINQGSGGGAMISNNLKDCLFVTGDAKWNEWIYANDNNVGLITIGHYSENYFIHDINNKLSNNFKDLKIKSYDINSQYKNYGE